MLILLAVTALALLALTTAVVWAGRVVSRTNERAGPVADQAVTFEDLTKLAQAMEKNEARLDSLTLAVAEGIERVSRAENRIAKTVTSARRLVAAAGLEHAGIEAEDQELRAADGASSDDQQVLPLSPVLEIDGPSGVPGLSRNELARLRGA